MDLNFINNKKTLIIDAKKLGSINKHKKEIEDVIVELARGIDLDIREADKNGLKEIETDLPVVFDVSAPISNSSIQCDVYFTIMKWLEWRNYKIQFKSYKKSFAILIRWRASSEKEIKELQMNYIKSKMKPIND
jgi:hypothetical protein